MPGQQQYKEGGTDDGSEVHVWYYLGEQGSGPGVAGGG